MKPRVGERPSLGHSPPPTPKTDDDARARMLARQRRQSRVRTQKRHADRETAILTGKALALTPDEYATLHGISVWTVYRRCDDGTLKHRKLGTGKRGGRILIYVNQSDGKAR